MCILYLNLQKLKPKFLGNSAQITERHTRTYLARQLHNPRRRHHNLCVRSKVARLAEQHIRIAGGLVVIGRLAPRTADGNNFL